MVLVQYGVVIYDIVERVGLHREMEAIVSIVTGRKAVERYNAYAEVIELRSMGLPEHLCVRSWR